MNRRIKSQVWKARKNTGVAAILYLGRSALVVAEDYTELRSQYKLALANGSAIEVQDPEGELFTVAAAKITSVRDTAKIEDEPEPDAYADSVAEDEADLASPTGEALEQEDPSAL